MYYLNMMVVYWDFNNDSYSPPSLCINSGLETTSTSLRWAMLLMAHHHDIQRRVRAEILEHVSLDRPPQMSDRASLRYTEAVLSEIQRFSSIAGSSVPRRAMRTVKVHEYVTWFEALLIPIDYAWGSLNLLLINEENYLSELLYKHCK